MKADKNQAPAFSLMKHTDTLSFSFLQMPLWLFCEKKYMHLSSDAKIIYTILLNRFQISKLNNWINDDGEVYSRFTRENMADKLKISYRKVLGCMKELREAELIWEVRCGNGKANKIFLAKAELSDNNDDGVPLPEYDEGGDFRNAVFTLLEDDCDFEDDGVSDTVSDEEENKNDAETNDCPAYAADTEPESAYGELHYTLARPAETAHQNDSDVQNQHFKNCENSMSECAEIASQDMQISHTSYIDINKYNLSYIENSQSVSPAPARVREPTDGQDREIAELDRIIEQCELWTFSHETAKVFENAIERLFFSESFKIGNAVLPKQKVRSHLHCLDQMKLQDAERKIARNTDKEIRNTTAYTMAVVFNSIWESESDIMNDAYLNRLRASPCIETKLVVS